MTKFELLKMLDIALASEIIFGITKRFQDAKALEKYLSEEIPEIELQRINDAARKEGRQPLSFSFRQ